MASGWQATPPLDNAQVGGWALVRSLDDALGALADNGFTSRAQLPVRRAAP